MGNGKTIVTTAECKDGRTYTFVTVARANVRLSTAFDQAIARAWNKLKADFNSAEAMSLDRYLELNIWAGR